MTFLPTTIQVFPTIKTKVILWSTKQKIIQNMDQQLNCWKAKRIKNEDMLNCSASSKLTKIWQHPSESTQKKREPPAMTQKETKMHRGVEGWEWHTREEGVKWTKECPFSSIGQPRYVWQSNMNVEVRRKESWMGRERERERERKSEKE